MSMPGKSEQQKTTIKQLVLVKYLFQKGEGTLDKCNPMACGLAISHFQDAVEMLIWTTAKEKNISVNEKVSFTELLNSVSKSIELPFKAKMEELNKARVNFKHYGNLPDASDARKFLPYTHEFLTWTTKNVFGVDFQNISLADLIRNGGVRELVKSAEGHFAQGELSACMADCAKAGSLVSSSLSKIIPQVESRIEDLSYLFERDKYSDARRLIRYLREYMNALRTLSVMAMLGIPLADYVRYENLIPIVLQMADNTWRDKDSRNAYTEGDAAFALRYVIDYAVSVEKTLMT